MRFSKVFLVKPGYKNSYYDYNDLPAGLGYLSHALIHAGIEHAVYDMRLHGLSQENLLDEIREYSPDLVGLSLMSFKYLSHYELINKIKEEFPSIKIIAGGPHPSLYQEKMFDSCHGVDFIARHEGEETLVELCEGKNLSDITGLMYRDIEGEIIYNGDRPFNRELDQLSFPTYEKFSLDHYDFITVITSRGCPYKCIFCPVPHTIGSKWRSRSAESVADEFEYWYRKGFYSFEIGDDCFNLDKNRAKELLKHIKSRGLDKIRIGLGNGIRADRVDPEMLQLMKDAGISYIAFGVEGGNNKILKNLRKGETIEEIEQGISLAVDQGFPVHLFFLVGSPGETESDLKDSVKLATKYAVVDVAFYNILPFPKSELYEKLESYGGTWIKDMDAHLNDSSHWVFSPVFETDEMSANTRIRLLKWANATVGRHTRKVKAQKIQNLLVDKVGLPRMVAKFIAYMVCSRFFDYVKNNMLPDSVYKGIKALVGAEVWRYDAR